MHLPAVRREAALEGKQRLGRGEVDRSARLEQQNQRPAAKLRQPRPDPTAGVLPRTQREVRDGEQPAARFQVSVGTSEDTREDAVAERTARVVRGAAARSGDE